MKAVVVLLALLAFSKAETCNFVSDNSVSVSAAKKLSERCQKEFGMKVKKSPETQLD